MSSQWTTTPHVDLPLFSKTITNLPYWPLVPNLSQALFLKTSQLEQSIVQLVNPTHCRQKFLIYLLLFQISGNTQTLSTGSLWFILCLLYLYAYAYIYIYYIYIYVYICIYVCMCMCMYIYMQKNFLSPLIVNYITPLLLYDCT